MNLVYLHHKAKHYGVPKQAVTRTNPVNKYGTVNRAVAKLAAKHNRSIK